MPIVVLVDEVAELFLMADKSEKDEVVQAPRPRCCASPSSAAPSPST